MTYTGWRGRENMGCLVYVGYMTNDEECHGVVISLFVVQRDERELSMSTLSGIRF